MPSRTEVAKPVSSDPQSFVADEIEKLDALRAQGVLTQQEFDQRKTKLLAR